MQELDSIINQLPERIDIQPFRHVEHFSEYWLVISLLLLVLIGISLAKKGLEFLPSSLQFMFSELFAFQFYNEHSNLSELEIILGYFFSFQLSSALFFLKIFPIVPSHSFNLTNVLLYSLGIYLFLLVKFLIFRTVKYLLPSRVDFKYYVFNYGYFCFYSSLFIMSFNIYLLVSNSKPSLLYFTIPMLFFYILILLRGVSISIRYNILGSIYFFLYLCTLEFIPIILISYAL